MKRFMFAASILIALAGAPGCSAIQAASDASGKTVSVRTVADARNTIYAVKSGYGAALVVATAYVNLPPCGQTNAPTLCSKREVVVQLVKAQTASSATINNAEEAILRTQGDSTSYLSTAVTAAQAAFDSFKAVMATYKVGGPS